VRTSSVTVDGVNFVVRPITSQAVLAELYGAILDYDTRKAEPGLGPSLSGIVALSVRLAAPDVADSLLARISFDDFETVMRALTEANEP